MDIIKATEHLNPAPGFRNRKKYVLFGQFHPSGWTWMKTNNKTRAKEIIIRSLAGLKKCLEMLRDVKEAYKGE